MRVCVFLKVLNFIVWFVIELLPLTLYVLTLNIFSLFLCVTDMEIWFLRPSWGRSSALFVLWAACWWSLFLFPSLCPTSVGSTIRVSVRRSDVPKRYPRRATHNHSVGPQPLISELYGAGLKFRCSLEIQAGLAVAKRLDPDSTMYTQTQKNDAGIVFNTTWHNVLVTQMSARWVVCVSLWYVNCRSLWNHHF